MTVTNVEVITVDGVKMVRLRSVDRNVHPWKYTVVEEAEAGDHQAEHSRNCDHESEARHYFNLLKR